ncbi:uncharacterized protein LOC126661343 [Mercurialis annua]|uniref:uncharacterized protein LOC126661343 n=1 Tax=Mercurialis annua TaxID=3986 RepID=UPI00215FDFAF|nr:uncharacterized protein LOC126661343 [Mercurialis annua]
MKKLFFFKSSSSSNGNNSRGVLTDKQVSDQAENGFRSPNGLFSKSRKQTYENSSSSENSFLRRSRSMSSAAFLGDEFQQNDFSCLGDQNRSPTSSISSDPHHECDRPSRRRYAALERRGKATRFGAAEANEYLHRQDRPGSSKSRHNSSESSTSSNVSSKVLDRYIDGEQQLERSEPKSNTHQRNFAGSGNTSGRLPPRVQYTAPASPMDGVKDKPRSHSFRDAKGTQLNFYSESIDNGFGHDSPRRLAKDVIERLSQTHSSRKSSLREYNYDAPITIEDVYCGSMNKGFNSFIDVPFRESYSLEEPLKSSQTENAVDAELKRRSKEAEERVLLLSEEIEQEYLLQDSRFDVSSLIQTIRNLSEDKLSLAIEVSGLLVSRVADRDTFKEEVQLAKSELESQTRRLEKEKNELQSVLEKELDRRSSDWSSKLEKYQSEEQRLRERVRELAEQNVSLQREVSSISEREQQLQRLNSTVEELSKENHDLRENFCELQNKHAVVEDDLNCIKRNFKDKDKECKELQKSTARLLRTCNEQGKSIEGLREAFSEDFEKKQSFDKFDKHMMKLQMEQMRLTGVELALRREVDSHRIEIDSLRQENIILLSRLKGKGEEIGALTFKLDKEIWTRTCCLQNQGLTMLKESTILCSKLLEIIRRDTSQQMETKQGMELGRSGLDGQFLVEADMKTQSLKRGIENFARSLQTISSLQQEKSSPGALKFELPCTNGDGPSLLNDQTLEDSLRCELKAETLLTSLLREKLYSKECEVEQLQAELAAAVRGNEILRSEIQNAMDNLSCAGHKLKDFELQMQKKDESIIRLENDLQESLKELTVIRSILPKVSEERDSMWEELKRYNEKNMLLNSEVNSLKKKIDTLDEDILLKEGEITILKDTLRSNRTFDLLASPDYGNDFLLK